jgi:hypothetical protein
VPIHQATTVFAASRKPVALLMLLACGMMAFGCDPCPKCPTEAVMATPTATLVSTPTFTPVVTVTPTFTPPPATPNRTQTFTPTATMTPSVTPTQSPTPTPSATPTGFGPMSFEGTYSLRFAGRTGAGNPDDAVGLLGSDGAGTITGLLTENKNGSVCQFVLGGTYTVNPDGTGIITVKETPAGGSCTANTVSEASVLFNMNNGLAIVNLTGTVGLGSLVRQQ